MSRLGQTSLEPLEPYDGKLSSTVLRGESPRKGADLLDLLAAEKLQYFPHTSVPADGILWGEKHILLHCPQPWDIERIVFYLRKQKSWASASRFVCLLQ